MWKKFHERLFVQHRHQCPYIKRKWVTIAVNEENGKRSFETKINRIEQAAGSYGVCSGGLFIPSLRLFIHTQRHSVYVQLKVCFTAIEILLKKLEFYQDLHQWLYLMWIGEDHCRVESWFTNQWVRWKVQEGVNLSLPFEKYSYILCYS